MIGIVGAGIGGLALSHYLDEGGIDHVVHEAEARAGGVIRSSGAGSRILDHGPQRTRLTPAVQALIRAAGLDEEVLPLAPKLPLYIYRDGRLRRVPFSFADLARTDLLTTRGKLRLLMEPATAAPELETVGALFIRKFGEEAYRHFLGPLFGGLFGSDPEEMYSRHALAPVLRGLGISRSILWPIVRRGAFRKQALPAVSFRTGMERLPEALAEKQRSRLKLGVEVEAVRRRGARWTIDSEGGEILCDGVVLTCAADVAARLLGESCPEAGRRLAALRYNRLALVHLHSETPLHGLGYQYSFGERARTRGVTWNAPAFDRDGIYTAFLGGARDPEVMELDDAGIGSIAAREFREVTGYGARPIGVSRTRMPAWDRSWSRLDGLELPAGLHLCANYESRVGIPGRVERARDLARTLGAGLSERAGMAATG